MDPSFRYPPTGMAQPYPPYGTPMVPSSQTQYSVTSSATPGSGAQDWQKGTSKKPSNILGVMALVIAIVALIAAIVMSVVWGTMSYGGSKTTVSNLIQGTSTKTTDDFTPEPSDLYIVNNTANPMTLNVRKPKTSLEGRIFIVDNTKGSSRVTVTSSELTALDNVGGGRIEPNTSAFYLGISDSSFQRLI